MQCVIFLNAAYNNCKVVTNMLTQDANLISMAGHTIGRMGQVIAWLAYLILLYCLLSAYMAGGADVINGLLGHARLHLSLRNNVLLFVMVFSAVVCFGIRSVDWVNRSIMMLKFVTFLGILLFTLPMVHASSLLAIPNHSNLLLGPVTVMITSYGFAIIIPSLRKYFNDNVKTLRLVVLIGSLIPLICYLLWESIIFGALSTSGQAGLMALGHSSTPITDLMHLLSELSKAPLLILFANAFTSLCVMTAFLGVSLCLTDFLADGLKVKKQGKQSVIIYVLTFLPPLLVVLFLPRLFVMGIRLAGIFVIILLMLLPAWMVWVGRYKKKFSAQYQVPGGKWVLGGLIVVSLCIIFIELCHLLW